MTSGPTLLENYMVTIMILEGRHYIWQNMDSAVIIKVDNKKKSTHVEYSTDCPFYNEYFVFEFFTTRERFLDKTLTITVIKPKSFCSKRKILGTVTLDFATIWSQRNHQFYHRWAVLTSPKSDVIGTTGFLKIDVNLLAKGEQPFFPANVVNDEIEGNLLLPSQDIKERQKANFIFDIYKCENLSFKTSTELKDNVKPQMVSGKTQENGPTTFIEVTFAGHSERTVTKKHTTHPIFNERLIISDLFPPLSQRAKLEISHNTSKSNAIVYYLNLKAISCDTTSGFLPTFGPSYIYLYSDLNLQGYAGSVLVTMDTEIEEGATMGPEIKRTGIRNVKPISEDSLFTFEETFLFATIYEATTLPKKFNDKLISFRITMGHALLEKTTGPSGDTTIANSTFPKRPTPIKKGYYCIDYFDKKPCQQLHSRWPDFRKRMFNSNMIEKIIIALKAKLDIIEEFLLKPQRHHYYDQLDKFLVETLDNFCASIKKYLDVITTNYKFDYNTKLDKERMNMLAGAMQKFLEKVEKLYNNKSRKHVFLKLYQIYKQLEVLTDDPQSCYPDIFLWMVCNNKKVAYIQIPARRLIYSPIDEEKGVDCGKQLFLRFKVPGKSQTICKIDIMLWLGLEKQKSDVLKYIPDGFKLDGELGNLRHIWSDEKHLFTCHAHIFEAKIQPGFDSQGLVDPFVQVIIADKLKETRVFSKCLTPIWDQTLNLYNIKAFGSKEYIRENPPTIVVQIFDKDRCGIEFVGRNSVKPFVKFLDDEETTPLKMKWFKLFNQRDVPAQILAIFELVEIKTEVIEEDEEEVIAIPQELRPHMVQFRLEVLFWGIRGVRKSIYRPKMVLLCGDKTLDSDVIENTKKTLNFPNPVKSLDLIMPEEVEYAHNMSLRLYDSRCFGVYSFAGVHSCETMSFIFTPWTVEERRSQMCVSKSSDTLLGSVVSILIPT